MHWAKLTISSLSFDKYQDLRNIRGGILPISLAVPILPRPLCHNNTGKQYIQKAQLHNHASGLKKLMIMESASTFC